MTRRVCLCVRNRCTTESIALTMDPQGHQGRTVSGLRHTTKRLDKATTSLRSRSWLRLVGVGRPLTWLSQKHCKGYHLLCNFEVAAKALAVCQALMSLASLLSLGRKDEPSKPLGQQIFTDGRRGEGIERSFFCAGRRHRKSQSLRLHHQLAAH